MSRSGDNKTHMTSPARMALFLMFLTIFGLAWWTYNQTDLRMRDDLLQQAGIVAQSIRLTRVMALNGAESDLSDHNYLRLKSQLMHLRHANPRCRFLYILGRHEDGTIFFHVDSEPEGSKDESPPGQTYDEAPASFHEVFINGEGKVVGPVNDRWGTWVTALVPLNSPPNAKPVAVLGMDIDAKTWKWEVFSVVALHAGLMLVLVFVVGSMWFAVRKFESSETVSRLTRAKID